MQIETKPFAPFGAILDQLLSENIKPRNSIFLYCGKIAESEAKKSLANGHIALCLPYGKTVSDYRWSIQGLRLIVYDTGSMSSINLKRISYELLKLGAHMVVVQSAMTTPIDIHILKKDSSNVRHRKNSTNYR